MLKFHSTLNALIFAIPSLMIIITFYNILKIFLCVNNIKKLWFSQKVEKVLFKCKSLTNKIYWFCQKAKVYLRNKKILLKGESLTKKNLFILIRYRGLTKSKRVFVRGENLTKKKIRFREK